jgi:hypothetical protein
MIWRANENVLRLSKTIAKQHRSPMPLFATGLPETCALLPNRSVIGCEAPA